MSNAILAQATIQWGNQSNNVTGAPRRSGEERHHYAVNSHSVTTCVTPRTHAARLAGTKRLNHGCHTHTQEVIEQRQQEPVPG